MWGLNPFAHWLPGNNLLGNLCSSSLRFCHSHNCLKINNNLEEKLHKTRKVTSPVWQHFRYLKRKKWPIIIGVNWYKMLISFYVFQPHRPVLLILKPVVLPQVLKSVSKIERTWGIGETLSSGWKASKSRSRRDSPGRSFGWDNSRGRRSKGRKTSGNWILFAVLPEKVKEPVEILLRTSQWFALLPLL